MRKLSKKTIIIFIVFTLFMVVLGVLKHYFAGSSGKPIYGRRKEEVEKVKFTSEDEKKLVDKIKADPAVTNVKFDRKAERITLLITVNASKNRNDAKTLGNSAISLLSKEQQKVYDLEVFIKSENAADKTFPIIGYRSGNCDENLCKRNECAIEKDCDLNACMQAHVCNRELTWTKDR